MARSEFTRESNSITSWSSECANDSGLSRSTPMAEYATAIDVRIDESLLRPQWAKKRDQSATKPSFFEGKRVVNNS